MFQEARKLIRTLSAEEIAQWMESENWNIRAIAMRACKHRTDIPWDVVEKGLCDEIREVRNEALESAISVRLSLPPALLKRLLKNADPDIRMKGLALCEGRDASLWLKNALKDNCEIVRSKAVRICRSQRFWLPVIEVWLEDKNRLVRREAVYQCRRLDSPYIYLKKGLKDSCSDVSAEAMRVCEEKTFYESVIEEWMEDKNDKVRLAAMKACARLRVRPAPYLLEKGAQDECRSVRIAAAKAADVHGVSVTPIRDIEPPERVYCTCEGGVIVAASIPKDAHIISYEWEPDKWRTNKAVIEEIIGDINGKKIGIFRSKVYCEGDEIINRNFDFDKCSQEDFYFRCAKEYTAPIDMLG